MEMILGIVAVVFGTKTIAGTLSALVLLIGSLTALFIYGRKAYRWFKTGFCKFNTGIEALIGTEAIIDPQTGKQLAPALPPIGHRLAKMEENITVLTELMSRQHALDERLTALMEDKKYEHKLIWEAIETLQEPQP